MAQTYYKPGLSDSTVTIGDEDLARRLNPSDVGVNQVLLNSGYKTGPAPVATGITPAIKPSGTPTVGDIYGSDYDKALAEQAAYSKSLTMPVDENKIRSDKMAQFQAEIDALNRYYAETKSQRLAAEAKLAASRTGQQGAIQARRGLAGSDFGYAATAKTEEFNRASSQGISDQLDAERSAKVSSILGQARSSADKEIELKNAARQAGYTQYINTLKTTEERRDQNLKQAVAGFINGSLEPTDEDYSALAGTLKLDAAKVKNAYLEAKKLADEATRKAAENNGVSVSPGSSYVDKVTGKVIYSAPAEEKHSAIYNEFVDYQKSGGKLNFNDYQTMDANRKRAITNVSLNDVQKVTDQKLQKEMAQTLGKAVGADGRVSPTDWNKLRTSWVNEGGTPVTFDASFGQFINPKDKDSYYTK